MLTEQYTPFLTLMYLYKVKIHGQKRAVKEWFAEPLEVGHTYAGPIGSESHVLYDVVNLVDIIIEN